MLKVSSEAITALTKEGMTDIAHLLRPAHLQQLSNILKDEEASENDKVRMEVEEGREGKSIVGGGGQRHH